MNKEKIKENWEEELEEMIERYGKYNWSDIYGGARELKIGMKHIKQFIHHIINHFLQAQKQDLIKKIKGINKYPIYTTTPACDKDEAMLRNTGYNQALEDIEQLLNNL